MSSPPRHHQSTTHTSHTHGGGGGAPLSRTPSRATSVSRGGTSTLSRNQSLIKKNIELSDLKPSDVLIERFVAWKAIVKQLIAYFEGIADIENNTARELAKLAGVIQVPFRSGNQFLGEDGLQDIYYSIRDKTRVISDHHADLGRTVDSSIVQHLQKLRTEIKAHIKNVQNDTGKLAAGVAKERELSTKVIGELANNVSSFKNTPMSVTGKTDPYVTNMHVAHQLTRQVLEENLLQKSLIITQQNSAHFEEGIVRAIQSAWQTYDEWQSRSALSIQDSLRSLSTHLASLKPDSEWIAFAARSDHLLDPDTPLRDPEAVRYPLKDDPSVVPVHTGLLERKKRFTRAYRESYFVLTPAGFLHSFASSDPANPASYTPTFSLFLPQCTLGPPSSSLAKSHKFHIEGTTDGQGTTKGGGLSLSRIGLGAGGKGAGGKVKAWSFRARSRDEMMEWWNDIRMLCARYLVASEQMARTGPVEAAVRAAGYVSEDEGEGEEEYEVDDDDDEGDGSSLEEGEEMYQDVREDDDTLPPDYTGNHHQYAGVEIGPNGYAVDKKNMPGQYPDQTQSSVSRRPSKRQQEKAPEGRSPAPRVLDVGDDGGVLEDRDHHDAGGEKRSVSASHRDEEQQQVTTHQTGASMGVDVPAPVAGESRFQEAL